MSSLTDIVSPAILWAIIGIVLIVIEMATMTFFLVFFGIAAIVVAIAKAFGLANFATELILFSVVGVLGLLFFRKKLEQVFAPRGGELQGDVAQTFVLTEAVPPHGEAIVEYQGSNWTAINESSARLSKGDRVAIVRTDGVKLIVRPS